MATQRKMVLPKPKCKFTIPYANKLWRKLLKELTVGEVKQLPGLDDTKVISGRENFQTLRRLCRDCCHDPEEQKQLDVEIAKTEMSDHACACLTFGFSGVDGIGVSIMNRTRIRVSIAVAGLVSCQDCLNCTKKKGGYCSSTFQGGRR